MLRAIISVLPYTGVDEIDRSPEQLHATRQGRYRLAPGNQPVARGSAHRDDLEKQHEAARGPLKPAASCSRREPSRRSDRGLHATHRAPRRPRGTDQLSGDASTRTTARPKHTALREAEEEIGIGADRIEILGRLPEYRTGTGYSVTPIVGWASRPSTSNPTARSRRRFEVPLAFLLDAGTIATRAVLQRAHRKYWRCRTRAFIWGATAGMLVTSTASSSRVPSAHRLLKAELSAGLAE